MLELKSDVAKVSSGKLHLSFTTVSAVKKYAGLSTCLSSYRGMYVSQ